MMFDSRIHFRKFKLRNKQHNKVTLLLLTHTIDNKNENPLR
jgi:hypothetical protein